MHFANCFARDHAVFHECIFVRVNVFVHACALFRCVFGVFARIFLVTGRLVDHFVHYLQLSFAGLIKLSIFQVHEKLQEAIVAKLVPVYVFLLGASWWWVHNVEFLDKKPGKAAFEEPMKEIFSRIPFIDSCVYIGD